MLNLLESAFDATMHADVDGDADGIVRVNKGKHEKGQPSKKVQAHGSTQGASNVLHPHKSVPHKSESVPGQQHHPSNASRDHRHGQSRAKQATVSPLSVTSSSRVGHDYAAISPMTASSHTARYEHASAPHLTHREWHTAIGAHTNRTENDTSRGPDSDPSDVDFGKKITLNGRPDALAPTQPTHYYPGDSGPENVVWLGHQTDKAPSNGVIVRGATARSSHPAKVVQPMTVTPTEESWTHGALHGRFNMRAKEPPLNRGNEARNSVLLQDEISTMSGMHTAVDHITQQVHQVRDRRSAGLGDIDAVEAREQAMAAEGEKHLFVITFITASSLNPTFTL